MSESRFEKRLNDVTSDLTLVIRNALQSVVSACGALERLAVEGKPTPPPMHVVAEDGVAAHIDPTGNIRFAVSRMVDSLDHFHGNYRAVINDEFGSKPKTRYVIVLDKVAGKELSKDIVNRHIEHLAKLDQDGRLVLCGPFSDHPFGLVVIEAKDKAEATTIAESDPFVREEVRTFEVRTWMIANRENNYLA